MSLERAAQREHPVPDPLRDRSGAENVGEEDVVRPPSPGSLTPSRSRSGSQIRDEALPKDTTDVQPSQTVDQPRERREVPGLPGMPPPAVDVDKLAAVTDHTLYRRYIVDKRRAVPITQFVWDKRAVHGQLRPVSNATVLYYQQALLAHGPPDLPYHCWCKETESVSPSAVVVFYDFQS